MLSATLRKTASRSVASRVISRGFAKEIKFGVEGRAAMLKGVETLADAVQVSFWESFFSPVRIPIFLTSYTTKFTEFGTRSVSDLFFPEFCGSDIATDYVFCGRGDCDDVPGEHRLRLQQLTQYFFSTRSM